ncbi:MAG: PKD domain-containing protein [Candidatus Hodarchaeota archaeon]
MNTQDSLDGADGESIHHSGPVPIVNFTANATVVLVNQSVKFTFTGDPGNTPSTYEWDFGDGTSNQTEVNPTHIFSAIGLFNVTLTVMDNDADMDTLTRDNYIRVLEPLADDDFDGFFNQKELIVGTSPLNYTDYPSVGDTYWILPTGGMIATRSATIKDVDNDGDKEVLVGSRDGIVYCVSGSTGKTEWTYPAGGGIATSILAEDVDDDGNLELFFGTEDIFTFFCLDASNGSYKWSFPAVDIIISTPALGDLDNDGDTEIIFGSWDDHLYCLTAKNGSMEWNYTTGSNVESSPLIADPDGDGKWEIFFGSADTSFYCLHSSNGTIKWSLPTASIIYGSPSLGDVDADGELEVVFGSYDHGIYCLNANNGSLEWNFTTSNYIYSSPVFADSDKDGVLEVFIGSINGRLYCLHGTNGTMKWSYQTGGNIYSTPAIGDIDDDGDIEVIFGSLDDKIYCFTALNGTLEWNKTTGGDVQSGPVLGDIDDDGKLEILIGSNDYKMYCLIGTGPSWAIPGPWPMFGGSATHGSLYVDDDGDGLTNSHELCIGTNITSNDTDGDGYNDSLEINSGTSPLNASDAPGLVSPIASFTFQPVTPVDGQVVNFTDASFDPDGMITSWEWSFGDGSPNSTAQDPNHAYNSSGNYTVTLSVTDNSNNTACTSQVVVVEIDLVPFANFTSNATTIIAGQAVQFTSTSTGGNAPLSCSWDFGDNSTNSSLQDPAHQYTTAGNYTVTLTITDRNGNSSIEIKVACIEVLEDLQPVPNFTANETSILEGDHVQFTYTGTAGNGNLSFQWDFGDNSTNSTMQDPVHQYITPGNYTVVLTVVDIDGDGSTFALPTTIEVGPDLIPLANFTTNVTAIAEREWINFTFTGSEGNAPASFQWDVGDGTANYTVPVFSHQYVDSGTYTVTLTVTDGDGDTNTTSMIDHIVVDKRLPTNGTVQHFDNGTRDVYLVDDQGTIWFELPGLVVLSPVDITLTLYLDINEELEGTYGIAAGFSIEFSDDDNVQFPATTIFHAWDACFSAIPDPSNLSLFIADMASFSLVNTNAVAVQHPGRCTFTLPVNGSGYFGIVSSNEDRIEFPQDVADITGYMPLVVMLALGIALGTIAMQSTKRKRFSSSRRFRGGR